MVAFLIFLSLLPSNKFYITNHSLFFCLFGYFPMHYFFMFFSSGIALKFFFSDCSLLVYRNVTDFSVLILHPTPLLKLFISCKVFCFIFMVITHMIMSSQNRDNFTTFKCILFLFVFFITVAETGDCMFTMSDENW